MKYSNELIDRFFVLVYRSRLSGARIADSTKTETLSVDDPAAALFFLFLLQIEASFRANLLSDKPTVKSNTFTINFAPRIHYLKY